MVLCDLPFLAPQFLPALSLHLPRKWRLREWPIQGARTAMQLQPSKRLLGLALTLSIFKTGLVLLLKDYFDQQSDKGKKKVANYLLPPTHFEFRRGELTTICKLTWIKFKNIKNASGLVSFILGVSSQHVESIDNSELKYLKLLYIINMPNSTSSIILALLMHRIPELCMQSLWRNNFTSSAESFQ